MRSTPRRDALLGALLSCMASACPALPDGPRFEGRGDATPRRGGTLMVWEESRVRMLDPHVAHDVTSGILLGLLFDSLYSYDQDMKLVPAIASAPPVVSEDGCTVTVPIRRGARFHNGRVLTARDVLWSFERMLHPDLQSPGAPYYREIVGLAAYQRRQTAHIAGLSAPDDQTFRIQLQRPDQSFAHTLALRFTAPMPREEVERKGADVRRRPVGQGPFRLVSWDGGVRLVLERHRHYWDRQRPYIDKVVFEEALKRDTAFMRFRNGEVDIVPRMSPADSMLTRSGRWKPYSALVPQADVWGIVMNTQLAPFDNVHLRRAVAFAIDRERWSRARNGMIRPTGQLLPPRIMGHDPALQHMQRLDLARARREMRLAGHPDGLREPVTLWTSDGSNSRTYIELLQADLAKIGVEVVPKQVSFPVYLEETGKPKTAQIMSAGWNMDYPDPSNLFSLVSAAAISEHDSMNRSFFSEPGLDKLLDAALVERDPVRRGAMYREANERVSEAAPWAFFGNSQISQAWQPYVKGYRPHPTYWMPLRDVWLDLPRRRIAGLLQTDRQRRLAGMLPLSWGGR